MYRISPRLQVIAIDVQYNRMLHSVRLLLYNSSISYCYYRFLNDMLLINVS